MFEERIQVGDTIMVRKNIGVNVETYFYGFFLYGNRMGIEKKYFDEVIIIQQDGKLEGIIDRTACGEKIHTEYSRMILTEKINKSWSKVI